eukprot:1649372-Rhodomonas_salina.2
MRGDGRELEDSRGAWCTAAPDARERSLRVEDSTLASKTSTHIYLVGYLYRWRVERADSRRGTGSTLREWDGKRERREQVAGTALTIASERFTLAPAPQICVKLTSTPPPEASNLFSLPQPPQPSALNLLCGSTQWKALLCANSGCPTVPAWTRPRAAK